MNQSESVKALHEIVIGQLRKSAEDFVRAATERGIKGLRVREDGLSVVVETNDREAFDREYGKRAGEPEGWSISSAYDAGAVLR